MIEPLSLSDLMQFLQSIITVYEDYLYLGLVIFITINLMIGIKHIMVSKS